MQNLLKIVKESGIHFSGSLIGIVLNYIWLMIITRFLSPENFGVFTLAQSIISISLIFVLFGIPKALDRFIPYYNAAKEEGKTKTLIEDSLKITFTLSLVIGIILFLGSKFLSTVLFHNVVLSTVLKIMVLSIPLLAFLQIISFSFFGFKEMRYPMYFQKIVFNLLKIILAITIFGMGYGLLGWIWMYILSLIGTCLLAYWFFKKYIGAILSKVSRQSISFRQIFSYAWPLSVSSIILIFLGQIDFLFLGAFRPTAEVGIYRIYLYLAAFLGFFLTSFAQIYKPVISGLISEGKQQEIEQIYKRVTKWIVILSSFIFFLFLLFGKDIIRVLFTQEYTLFYSCFLILITGQFVHSALGPQGMSLESYGNTRLILMSLIGMAFVNTSLDYLLVPSYGAVGAAIATIAALIFVNLLMSGGLYKLHRLHPFTRGYLLCIFAFAVTIFISIVLIFYLPLPSYLLRSLIAGVAFCIIYISFLYIMNIVDDTDKQVLRDIYAKISRRE